MPFKQNIKKMQELADKAPSVLRYSKSINPHQELLPELTLLYPGRIKKGDYKLEYNGIAFTHPDVVQAIYDCTSDGNGEIITNFLVDLYQNGLGANSNFDLTLTVRGNNFTLEQFKYLIYWLVLQEDINFPRPRFMGVRMPIIRYIEGAIAALHPNLLTLQEVINRTNNHGRPPEKAFYNPSVSAFLTHNINKIK